MASRGLDLVFLVCSGMVLGAEAQCIEEGSLRQCESHSKAEQCSLGNQECGSSWSDDLALLQFNRLSSDADLATAEKKCIEKGSLGQCEACLKGEQCAPGKFCCPYMRKCVASSSDSCYFPIAGCQPMCFDTMDNSKCTCTNADFPDKWQLPTCTEDTTQDVTSAPATPEPAASQPATPASTTPEPIIPEPSQSTSPQAAGGVVSPPSQSTASQATGQIVSAPAWKHFQLLNELRAEGFTCPGGTKFKPNPVPLKFDCRLWAVASSHTADMVANDYFSQTPADGRPLWEIAAAQGTSATMVNIAAGSPSASGVLDQLKQSDSQCTSIMNADLKVAGVGYTAGGTYGHYWVDMASPSTSAADSATTDCYP
mmetsp:Transcript_14465/g.36576  ORF Transcript_14465/g.36576 Transcript_14465/m.36576 type:complete len:369 (-) Transcript_14465:146-1252(-)|eukprot:CAMPEP_0115269782 /NCGR_PEP_ID=MMETSP0270-20121206/53223_1 /TAXON_ID=71861 /ORGANISM="Scrippsiella trochoidea, Strain CCMP3099" /LENGTH=368 /DNA_ID=CAMNT_0002686045 /DNA_START=60 /DNA_END=1166 /DNA_ORIENTATION=+